VKLNALNTTLLKLGLSRYVYENVTHPSMPPCMYFATTSKLNLSRCELAAMAVADVAEVCKSQSALSPGIF
jgi:hypothetical protein